MNLEKGLTIAVAILTVIALFNAFTVLSMGSKLDTKITQLKEAAKAPVITLTTISANCNECADITPMIETIKGSHVNITEERQVDAANADELIEQFGILKLPAIIIEGEVDKVSIQRFESTQNGLVYQTTAAPYYNVLSDKVEGLVEAWVLEANCEECMDMQEILDAFTLQGVMFSKVTKLGQSDAAASKLIADNNIKRLPALLYSDDISAYPEVLLAMEQGGFVKSNDLHLYESTVPFYDVEERKVKGFVSVTYLNDATCTECYDVTIHKQILERFGMVIGTEKTIDISSSEGKSLVAQHSLTSIPSVIVSGDIELYEGFDQVWGTVGTVENGNYVFRNNGVFLPQFSYKNLTTGEIVKGEIAEGT